MFFPVIVLEQFFKLGDNTVIGKITTTLNPMQTIFLNEDNSPMGGMRFFAETLYNMG